jgi:tetratricopeptide (TPR) repeat protein
MGNLAISYDSAGRRAESMKLMEEVLPLRRKVLGPDHPETLTSMNDLGLSLLDAGELDKAEKMLRDCLAIRKKKLPNEWHTFNTQSQLGAVLLAAGKNAEAEKLLLDGFNGMKQREKTIPVEQLAHLKEAAERLSRFYDETGKGEEAKKWKAEGAKYGQPGK